MLPDRFWEKVDKSGDCWQWTGSKGDGYGKVNGFHTSLAHRLSYEEACGPIPEGLQLDHLCRNRACVKPGHLEAVTQKVNQERGSNATRTHCKHGHEYTPENTKIIRSGSRWCRECGRERTRRWNAKRKLK